MVNITPRPPTVAAPNPTAPGNATGVELAAHAAEIARDRSVKLFSVMCFIDGD
ncbi:hypothetical protein P4S72_19010 [Vibrio sp. PP-XX7]